MKKLIMILIVSSLFLGGCASFRDAKKYEMKKSPCACIESTQYIEQSLILG